MQPKLPRALTRSNPDFTSDGRFFTDQQPFRSGGIGLAAPGGGHCGHAHGHGHGGYGGGGGGGGGDDQRALSPFFTTFVGDQAHIWGPLGQSQQQNPPPRATFPGLEAFALDNNGQSSPQQQPGREASSSSSADQPQQHMHPQHHANCPNASGAQNSPHLHALHSPHLQHAHLHPHQQQHLLHSLHLHRLHQSPMMVSPSVSPRTLNQPREVIDPTALSLDVKVDWLKHKGAAVPSKQGNDRFLGGYLETLLALHNNKAVSFSLLQTVILKEHGALIGAIDALAMLNPPSVITQCFPTGALVVKDRTLALLATETKSFVGHNFVIRCRMIMDTDSIVARNDLVSTCDSWRILLKMRPDMTTANTVFVYMYSVNNDKTPAWPVHPLFKDNPDIRCHFVYIDFLQMGAWWAVAGQQNRLDTGMCEMVSVHNAATGQFVEKVMVSSTTTFLDLIPETMRRTHWMFYSANPRQGSVPPRYPASALVRDMVVEKEGIVWILASEGGSGGGGGSGGATKSSQQQQQQTSTSSASVSDKH